MIQTNTHVRWHFWKVSYYFLTLESPDMSLAVSKQSLARCFWKLYIRRKYFTMGEKKLLHTLGTKHLKIYLKNINIYIKVNLFLVWNKFINFTTEMHFLLQEYCDLTHLTVEIKIFLKYCQSSILKIRRNICCRHPTVILTCLTKPSHFNKKLYFVENSDQN